MKIKGIMSSLSERKEFDLPKELFLLKGRKENIKEGYSLLLEEKWEFSDFKRDFEILIIG